jgi:hypothetical protein
MKIRRLRCDRLGALARISHTRSTAACSFPWWRREETKRRAIALENLTKERDRPRGEAKA